MYRLAGYVPVLPGYYTFSVIVNNVDVNKYLILENNLFIYNNAIKFNCL